MRRAVRPAASWPDVPFDLNCANGATCAVQSPTFWSEYELTGVQTQSLVGTALTNVDGWALSHSFPATADTTGAGVASYVYDAEGSLVVRRDPATTTLFLGDTQVVLDNTTKAVTGTRYYTVGGMTIAARTNVGAATFLVPDPHGSALLAVTEGNQTVTRRLFLPFGGPRGAAPTTWPGGSGFLNAPLDAMPRSGRPAPMARRTWSPKSGACRKNGSSKIFVVDDGSVVQVSSAGFVGVGARSRHGRRSGVSGA